MADFRAVPCSGRPPAAAATAPALRSAGGAADQPITLATLIGAGAHPDGTSTCSTRPGTEYRVFVGSGLEVRRKRVAGSSEFAVAGGRAVTVSVTEAEPPFRLKVEMTGEHHPDGRAAGDDQRARLRDRPAGRRAGAAAGGRRAGAELHNLGAAACSWSTPPRSPTAGAWWSPAPRTTGATRISGCSSDPPERVEERKVDSVTPGARRRHHHHPLPDWTAPPPRRSSPHPRT